MVRVRLTRIALRARRRIHTYYRSKSPSAAAHFEAQVEAAPRYVADYPEGAELVRGTRYEVNLDFPYSVLYEIERGEVIVTTIASHYQRAELK